MKRKIKHETISLPKSDQRLSYLRRQPEFKSKFIDSVLLIHGLGCSADDFIEATCRPELASWEILAVDLPGSGQSPYPESRTYSIKKLAEILSEFISELSATDKLVVAGHSMGAIVALRLAEQNPRVRSIIGIDPANALWGPSSRFRAREIQKTSLGAFKETGFPELVTNFSESSNAGFQKHAKTLAATSPLAYYNYCQALVEEADHGELLNLCEELVAEGRAPKFICAKENEDTSSSKRIMTLKATGSEINFAPGHHFLYFENPNEFYSVLSEVLNQVSARAIKG